MLFETWHQTHFLLYESYKHVFSQHFLNYSFHIILNDTKNLKPKDLQFFYKAYMKFAYQ